MTRARGKTTDDLDGKSDWTCTDTVDATAVDGSLRDALAISVYIYINHFNLLYIAFSISSSS